MEAKYPALLFKQQLGAAVTKIFGAIRDNVKKEMTPALTSAVHAPKAAARLGHGADRSVLLKPWADMVATFQAVHDMARRRGLCVEGLGSGRWQGDGRSAQRPRRPSLPQLLSLPLTPSHARSHSINPPTTPKPTNLKTHHQKPTKTHPPNPLHHPLHRCAWRAAC